MSKLKRFSRITIFVTGLCVIIFVIIFFSINGEHHSDGYTFEVDFWNGNAKLISIDNTKQEYIQIPSRISFFKVNSIGGIKVPGLKGGSHIGIFENNDIVKEITISEGVERTELLAISGCEKLERVYIPSTMKSFSINFCENLREVCIADGTTELESFCLQGCKNLKTIKLPSRVSEIRDTAFYNCNSLKNIELPNIISKIGDNSFESCSSIEEIDLPQNLKSIGRYAFNYCTLLERINIYDKCSSIADDAFEGCDNITIYGVKGSYAEQYAYKHKIPFKEL